MARAARQSSRVDNALLAACVVVALVIQALPEELRSPLATMMRRTVVAPLVAMQRSAELTRAAFLSQESLRLERDSVALQAMHARALEAENDRLRRLLGLASRLEWGFVPAEALHNDRVGDEFELTLTAGSDAGVRPFTPVLAPEGLVGMVKTVDPAFSTAIIWPNADFRVSAMAADGSAYGIVAAHLGDGPERYLLELRGVPFRNELEPGTLILSSGLGGVYPRGIPIGTVLQELETPEGWARTYLLRPAVRPPDISSVMILRRQRADSGVARVWIAAVRADSIARVARAAGDSIVRADSAAAERARTAAATAAGPDTGRRTDPVATAPPAPPPTTTSAPSPPRRTPPAAVPATGGRDTAAGTGAATRGATDTSGRPTPRRDTAGTQRRDTAPPPRDTQLPSPFAIPPAPRPDTAPPADTARPVPRPDTGGAPPREEQR